MTIFNSDYARKLPTISGSHPSSLMMRFVRRFAVCLFYTVPAVTVLAHYAVPAIVRMCAVGSVRGFGCAVLLHIWVLTLLDMWQHVLRDFRRIYAFNQTSSTAPAEAAFETSPKI
jgi:hypothetical protein